MSKIRRLAKTVNDLDAPSLTFDRVQNTPLCNTIKKKKKTFSHFASTLNPSAHMTYTENTLNV